MAAEKRSSRSASAASRSNTSISTCSSLGVTLIRIIGGCGSRRGPCEVLIVVTMCMSKVMWFLFRRPSEYEPGRLGRSRDRRALIRDRPALRCQPSQSGPDLHQQADTAGCGTYRRQASGIRPYSGEISLVCMMFPSRVARHDGMMGVGKLAVQTRKHPARLFPREFPAAEFSPTGRSMRRSNRPDRLARHMVFRKLLPRFGQIVVLARVFAMRRPLVSPFYVPLGEHSPCHRKLRVIACRGPRLHRSGRIDHSSRVPATRRGVRRCRRKQMPREF